ncbi:MAG: hypothetical protein K9M10_03825 [Candidatus Pacebacteria bacterium]|nr:hypothetical protein [Candidatus Paceibacterota bacterium]MCF7857580.1 hypothetical protein [Candidatus Paceibacterota bacterium]
MGTKEKHFDYSIWYTGAMSDSDNDKEDQILRLLKENAVLLKQNNEILSKLYRHNVIGFVIRIAWYAILIGMPFALYYYILEPYFNVFGANYEVFRRGMAEIPGLKGLEYFLPAIGE